MDVALHYIIIARLAHGDLCRRLLEACTALLVRVQAYRGVGRWEVDTLVGRCRANELNSKHGLLNVPVHT